MRVGMGLVKNEHGVWHVRKKVPKALEAATATVTEGVPGGWWYVTSVTDTNVGNIYVRCTHTDTKGTIWTSY